MMRPHPCLAVYVSLVLASLAAPACTVKPTSPLVPEQERLSLAWDAFHAGFTESCRVRDFFARGSVNYTSGERSARLLFSFWGRTSFPVRMDLQAGVGTILAHWREDAQGWLGYTPGNQEALFASDSRIGAAAMGLAMPLRLDMLAQVLAGCWQEIVPGNFIFGQCVEDRCDYHVEHHGLSTILTLGLDGRPMALRENAPEGWEVAIEQWFEDAPGSPRRLGLRQGQNTALVRLQRLEFKAKRWGESDLALELPPGTMRHVLEPPEGFSR